MSELRLFVGDVWRFLLLALILFALAQLAHGCATTQITVTLEEGSGSARASGKADTAPVVSLHSKIEVPVSLTGK